MLGKQRRDLACEGVQRGKPDIRGRSVDASLGLDMVQEGEQVLTGETGGEVVPVVWTADRRIQDVLRNSA